MSNRRCQLRHARDTRSVLHAQFVTIVSQILGRHSADAQTPFTHLRDVVETAIRLKNHLIFHVEVPDLTFFDFDLHGI